MISDSTGPDNSQTGKMTVKRASQHINRSNRPSTVLRNFASAKM
ncbi:MAG: hypothetical protein PHR96_00930 [Clostridia bacterium]|nr:hypothetical protein [Clostridia bacterium]